jgi:hypothetical protein
MDVDWFCCLFSTFNQSITNSDRGIFEPNTTNIATLENRKNRTDSRNNAFISKVGSKYKANDNFQLITMFSLEKTISRMLITVKVILVLC